MILADQHMHSTFSPDGTSGLSEMARTALDRGLKAITFTEHMDMELPVPPGRWPELDPGPYRAGFLQTQQEFAGQLDLGWGVEFGMQPHLVERGQAFLARNNFDFVIASCHTSCGRLPTHSSYYEGRSKKEALEEYFTELGRCLALFDNYDVCGHIDYVVRYCPGGEEGYRPQEYAEFLDPLLRTVIEKGKGIEMNTGAFRYGMTQPNPCAWILKRYRELGGRIITVGSDAHRAQDVASDFERGRQVLLDCGFTEYAVYRNRQPQFLAL